MKCWVAQSVSLLVFLVSSAEIVQHATAQNTVMCYYSSWASFREGNGKFTVGHIDPHLCTHLVYAFVGLELDGSVRINDPGLDLELNGGLGGFRSFNNLRQQNPQLKTLIAIGGWNEGSYKFSQVVRDPTLRATFVNNLYSFVKHHDFSGLDLDWEYPAGNGGAPEDKANFVALVRELHDKFRHEGLMLTAAVSASVSQLHVSYDVPEIVKYVDFIHLMTYDFHGSWEHKTGINSPLYPSSVDTNNDINSDATVRAWLHAGAPSHKLLLGIPAYGRSYTLLNPNSPGLGALADGPGKPGPLIRESGFLGFNEVLESMQYLGAGSYSSELQICHLIYPGGYSLNWAAQQMVPFAFRGDQWVGFDNVRSVNIKAEYARSNNLGGMLVWGIETDDYHNLCGQGSMPLTNAMKRALNS